MIMAYRGILTNRAEQYPRKPFCLNATQMKASFTRRR